MKRDLNSRMRLLVVKPCKLSLWDSWQVARDRAKEATKKKNNNHRGPVKLCCGWTSPTGLAFSSYQVLAGCWHFAVGDAYEGGACFFLLLSLLAGIGMVMHAPMRADKQRLHRQVHTFVRCCSPVCSDIRFGVVMRSRWLLSRVPGQTNAAHDCVYCILVTSKMQSIDCPDTGVVWCRVPVNVRLHRTNSKWVGLTGCTHSTRKAKKR